MMFRYMQEEDGRAFIEVARRLDDEFAGYIEPMLAKAPHASIMAKHRVAYAYGLSQNPNPVDAVNRVPQAFTVAKQLLKGLRRQLPTSAAESTIAYCVRAEMSDEYVHLRINSPVVDHETSVITDALNNQLDLAEPLAPRPAHFSLAMMRLYPNPSLEPEVVGRAEELRRLYLPSDKPIDLDLVTYQSRNMPADWLPGAS